LPAKYDLDDIKKIASDWLISRDDTVWVSPKKKTTKAIQHVLGEEEGDALTTIAKGFLELKTEGFLRATYYRDRNVTVDIYGLPAYRGHNWYVKFCKQTECGDTFITSISFHPLNERMSTECGKQYEVTYTGERPWKDS